MQLLFVCYGNVGRSQVAQTYFNVLSKHQAQSAGIAVNALVQRDNVPGKRLRDLHDQISVSYLRHTLGIDIADRERQQLLPVMLDLADLTIVIAEKERWPSYLQEGEKVVFWDIPDALGQTEAIAYDIFSQVQRKVEQLVAEIG
jgi:protein-tyrosine-phosphatase